MSQGTADALHLDGMILRSGYYYTFGGFTVTVFRTEHDCAEPIGFLIEHLDFGRLLFITDSAFVKPNFKKLAVNHILCECNYSQSIIDSRVANGETIQGLRDRVLKSHMELQTTKDFIAKNKTPILDSVLLLHLSEGNADPKLFQEEIQEVVGDKVKVNIATRNFQINLDICPF